MVTEPVVWSMTPLIVSTRPLSAYMVPSMSCNCTFGIFSRISLVLPKAEIPHIKAKYTLDGKELTAPISAHQLVGEIELYDRDKQVAHWPLVTLESVGEGSMFSRLSDYFHHKD